jgi:thiol-disulfide isomerase/thioredoxin
MNKIMIGVVGVLFIGLIAFNLGGSEKEVMMVEKEGEMMEKQEEVMMDDNEAVMQKEDKEAMMAKENMDEQTMEDKEAMMDKDEAMMKAGAYEAYSADKIARAETGDVVIFFHASWCPSCRGLNSSIESNLKSIPEGVTILKADYDKETELKKKYGVTNQHTLVQVDKEGNLIKKWSGGSSLDNLLSQIQ